MPDELLDPGTRDFWLMVGTALLCGGAVGLERQMRGKVAGMRTSILICLGTAFFIRLGLAILPVGGDPTRVLGQVVSGIGFLGAGVILARGDRIMGVTTAAVIWILAAVGALIGAGFLRAGLTATLLTLLVLLGIEGFENMARRRGLRGSGMHGQVDGD
ncbi:MAG: MgtC/SapB family protein [Gemmatimonadota bacterium]|nr:MgtC/SapB family protein [Gemmatimonadota bacterium]